MHVVVTGGTGHIGSYLVPRLVDAGHDVTVVTRGTKEPYRPHQAWEKVRRVVIDREAADKKGTFGKQIADLGPDTIIDLICFTEESGRQLVEAVRGKIQQLVMCCTIWVHGYSETVPTTEDQPKSPFGDYGVNKEKLESYLLEEARKNNFPVAIIHPGHIVGEGWVPLNPQGHFNIEVWKDIKAGKELLIPNIGLETVHHVHADDVSGMFMAAMNNWSTSVGESFHTVSPKAVTLRGYAEAVFGWFGHEPKLTFAPWEEFKTQISEDDAWFTWDHIGHSPCCSIEKARRMLGFTPRYTSLEALYESVMWLDKAGKLG